MPISNKIFTKVNNFVAKRRCSHHQPPSDEGVSSDYTDYRYEHNVLITHNHLFLPKGELAPLFSS